jgi:beige protein homolog 1
LHDFGDVRELTPDFYSTPEMYLNLNHCNFGIKEEGQKVDDVVLPEWANKNPHKFVQIMREALESPYVS